MRRIRWIILLLVIGGVVGFGVWWEWFETYHLATVQVGVLYRDGVRSKHELENALRKVKARTVVRLVDEDEQGREPFAGEVTYCHEHGIAVIDIPIRLGGWPTMEQVNKFLRVATDAAKQPVLVHCAQGVRRTGMMTAAFEMKVLGWDRAKTQAAVLSFGHSHRTIDDVLRFIDGYDPVSGGVPTSMPANVE
jgi:protein-tyrosine phosphatase